MAPALFGLVAFGAIALLFALFGRGGPRETGGHVPARLLGRDQLVQLSRTFLERRGFAVDSVDLRERGSADLVATDPRPGVGQTLYVRVVSGDEPAGTAEVQAAVDRLKGDGLSKALLISEAGFSDEAVAAAEESAVELMEANSLEPPPAPPA